MKEIFDLPAHPLMVHFPVVAIPLLAVLAIVVAVRPTLRNTWKYPLAAFAVITAAATVFAAGSGEALAEVLYEDWETTETDIDEHAELGEFLRLLVIGLTVVLLALLALTKRNVGGSLGRNVNIVASTLVVVLSIASLIWVVRVGHEGAKASWEGVDVAGDDVDVTTSDDTTSTTLASTTGETTTGPATTEPPTTEPATTAPATTGPPSTTTPTDTAPTETTTAEVTTTVEPDTSVVEIDGMAIFENNCARCHLSDGSGRRGPSLIGKAAETDDLAEEIEQITNGGGGMPTFGTRLAPEKILAVIEYYRTTFVEVG